MFQMCGTLCKRMLEMLKMYVGSRTQRISHSRIPKRSSSCICLRLSLNMKKLEVGRAVVGNVGQFSIACSWLFLWMESLARQTPKTSLVRPNMASYLNLPGYIFTIYPSASTGVCKELAFPKRGGEMGEDCLLVMNKMGVSPLRICTCTYSDMLFELRCLMI